MTNTEIRARISCDTLSKKDGVYTARWGYYWGITKSGETKARVVEEMLTFVEVLDYGNHYSAFKGGAGVARNSHYWVKFKMTPNPMEEN